MSYQCPWCATIGTYRNNISKHLRGTEQYNGHELTNTEAESVISSIDSGAPITIRPRANPPREPNGSAS